MAKVHSIFAVIARHLAALLYVVRNVLPVILRSGRRPVAFSRWSGMGDIICTFPAALELKKRHPSATFLYNCHPDFAPVVLMAGVADQCTHCTHDGVAGHWYRFLFGGFYHFAHGDDIPGETSKESMVAEFCRQFGLPVQDEHPRIQPPLDVRNRARTRLIEAGLDPDALIIIHPGPSWPVREWPFEKWQELVSGLRQQGFTDIVQIGVGRYSTVGKVRVNDVPGTVSLVDKLSLEEAFAVISCAKLYIGIDSGPLHIAAAVGAPAVGLFGMTSPHTRFSRAYIRSFVISKVSCQGCYHRLPRVDWITGCPNDIQCMRTLPVDAVLCACLRILRPDAIHSQPNQIPWKQS